MVLDLALHYDPPTSEPGSFGLVSIWRRKPNVTSTLPPQVAVKEVSRLESFRVEGTTLVEEDSETLLSIRHKNIVKIYQFTMIQLGIPLVVMEACAGTLDSYIQIYPCCIDDLRLMGPQILAGLEYLHQRGIIHRDVKPSNILVNSLDQRVVKEVELVLKLADFGSSKQMSDSHQTATIRGSPKYMAPEILKAFRSQEDTAFYNGSKVDIFSAGVTFFKMLKGVIPFTIDDRSKSDFDHAEFLCQCGINDQDCISLLSQMLSWNSSERRSANQLLQHAFFSQMRNNSKGSEKLSHVVISNADADAVYEVMDDDDEEEDKSKNDDHEGSGIDRDYNKGIGGARPLLERKGQRIVPMSFPLDVGKDFK
jgi:serine/threonine protein kinase